MKKPCPYIILFFLLVLSLGANAQINKELKAGLSKTLSPLEKKILYKADKYSTNSDYQLKIKIINKTVSSVILSDVKNRLNFTFPNFSLSDIKNEPLLELTSFNKTK